MQKTLTINDTLLENASKCVGLDDVNEVVNMALQELLFLTIRVRQNVGNHRFQLRVRAKY